MSRSDYRLQAVGCRSERRSLGFRLKAVGCGSELRTPGCRLQAVGCRSELQSLFFLATAYSLEPRAWREPTAWFLP
jgi:hypothetical protein